MEMQFAFNKTLKSSWFLKVCIPMDVKNIQNICSAHVLTYYSP